MRSFLVAATLTLASVIPVQAAAQAVSDLVKALRLSETVEILHLEGLEYGDSIADELFPGLSGPSWRAAVRQIYDPAEMEAALAQALVDGLDAAEAEVLATFFASQLGRQIVQLEISARRALLDPSVDEASREALAAMLDDKDPRLEKVRAYSEANGLVEENVVGALNANFAFYMGLKSGGALPGEMSDQQILADVWSQEEDIRANTEEWVLSYLSMAYRPLSDADLDAYIALSESPEGRALNRALFDGFDQVFVGISRALGEAAARQAAGEDI